MQCVSSELQRKQHTPGKGGILHTSMVHRGPCLSRDCSQHKHQIAAASQEAGVNINKVLWLQEHESQGRRERKVDSTNWVLEYTSNRENFVRAESEKYQKPCEYSCSMILPVVIRKHSLGIGRK